MTDHGSNGASATASFGFREVPAGEKASLVRQVFDSVAARYDLMNDLMSLGVHRLWKESMADAIMPRPGERLIDVAGGTGDIAFRLNARAAGQAEIVVSDINAAMLSVGRDRAIDRGLLAAPLRWAVADAERLPFPERSFDAYSIAFGLRNVTDIDQALRDARRCLKIGGRFFCLEFSKVALPALGAIYDRYSAVALPAMGRLVAGDAESYRYLHESIRRFPPQETLAERMRAAGFENVKYRNFSGGIVALHSGWRL